MSYRGWLLVQRGFWCRAVRLGAQEEFPIGAWFPGMIEIVGDEEAEEAEWAMRLDSVKAARLQHHPCHAQGRGHDADLRVQPTLDGPGPRPGPEGAAAQLAAAARVAQLTAATTGRGPSRRRTRTFSPTRSAEEDHRRRQGCAACRDGRCTTPACCWTRDRSVSTCAGTILRPLRPPCVLAEDRRRLPAPITSPP